MDICGAWTSFGDPRKFDSTALRWWSSIFVLDVIETSDSVLSDSGEDPSIDSWLWRGG